MKPRVLVLTSTYPRWPGDIEPGFVHELCKRLVADYEVHVLTSHFAGAAAAEEVEGVHIHRFRYAPVRLQRLVYPGGMLTNIRLHPWLVLLLPVFMLSQLVTAWRLAAKLNVRIIHAHWVIPQGLVAYLLRPLLGNVALVVTSHGADVYGLSGGVFRFLKRRVWAAADRVTVVSSAMAARIAPELLAREAVVAPMGVDLREAFVPREPLAGRKNVIYVGRLVEKKGVDVLLAALPGLLARYPQLRLTLVGDGPYREQLLRQAADLSLATAVQFLGAVPNAEIPALLNQHAIAVVPSVIAAGGDQEGLGLVSVEAMGCGCAVVASDLPAIRDVVEDQVTGLMFEAGNPRALVTAVARLLEDDGLRLRLAQAGRDAALARFDWSSAAASYRRLFAELL